MTKFTEFLRYKEKGYGPEKRSRLFVNQDKISAVVEDINYPTKTVIRLSDGRKGFEVFAAYDEVLFTLGLLPQKEVVKELLKKPPRVRALVAKKARKKAIKKTLKKKPARRAVKRPGKLKFHHYR